MGLGGRYRRPGAPVPRRKWPWWQVPATAAALKAEHDRHLPALTAAYHLLPPALQARVGDADGAFIRGENPLPFMRWARTVIPGIFPVDMRERAAVEANVRYERMRAEAEASFGQRPPHALEPPPRGPLYHGTNNHEVVTNEGLCVGSWEAGPEWNSILIDSDYGWEGFWREEVWGSYRRMLDTDQRRRLHQMMGLRKGERFAKWMLDSLAVFWATHSQHQAGEYARHNGAVLEIDPSKIDYYWFFGDELAGGEAIVFVCPPDCPQVPPSGLAVLP